MKKLGLVLLVILYLISINKVKSNIVMGADITWRCVGQDSFLVKLVAYRDCNSVAMPSIPITFKCATTGATITTLTIAVGTPVDITPVCSSSCTRCSSPSCSFPYGINRYTMQGIVKLSGAGSCCGIVISWQFCCRTSVITTGPANQNFYIESKLNRCLNPCDNSPTFSNPPIAILCSGQSFTFNHGVQDIDVNSTGGLADSLTIEWAEPLSAANTPISYISPYAYNKAINFYGFPNDALPWPRGIHLDPQTGDIQFQPTKAEVTVMVIRVNEFRNGVKIGEVRRDLMIIVDNCPGNKVPLVTTPNNVRSKSICPGDPVTFNFSTSDSNTNDSVTLNWNNAIPGATWTHNNGQTKRPTATFSWAPTASQASSLPYTFTVTAKDNACPLKAQFTQSYQIMVNPIPKANIAISDSGCGKYYFKALPITGTSPTYKWSSDSFTFTPNTGSLVSHIFLTGSYPVKLEMTTPGCSRSFYDTAVINPFMSVSLPADTTVWVSSTITLQASVANATSSYKLKWGSGKVTFTGDTTLTKQIKLTKDTTIWIRATYGSFNCPFDEIRIKVHSKYKIRLPQDTFFCGFNNSLYPAFFPNISAFRSFKWFKKGSSLLIDTDACLNISDTGLFICVATDTFGFSFSDTVHIHKNPEVIATALGKTICYGADTELEANSSGVGIVTYNWYDGTKLIGNTKKIKVRPFVTTDYWLKVSETLNGVTCKDSTMIRVNINPLPLIKIDPIDQRCENISVINLNGFVTVDGIFRPGGTWSSPSAGLIYGDWFNPVVAGASIAPGWKVIYEYTNPTTGCYNKDSGYVTVFALPKPYAGTDDSICTGAKIKLTGTPLLPPGTWRGTGVEGSYPNWKFNPDASGIINGGSYEAIYHYKDNNQCVNEDTVRITVFNSPIVDAGTPKEFCEDADAITLTGNPTGGIWTGKGVAGNQFVPSLATPGVHVLTYTCTNAICTVSDTVTFIVYPFHKPPRPVISLSASDFFLECNLTYGKYQWYYRPDTITAPTNISNNLRRINPKIYCKKCYFGVIYTDSNGCVSDTSAPYHYFVNSIDKNTSSSRLVFYPNPVQSVLFAEYSGKNAANLILRDILGNVIMESRIVAGKTDINLQKYKPGIYFIFLNGVIAGKIMVE